MSDLDALLWDLESHDPAMRPVITVVVLLDRQPDPAAVAARIDQMSTRVPALRDRVTRGPLRTAPPWWEPDPDFDPAHHVVDAGVVGGTAGALQLAARLASEPFAAGRPPWQMHLAGLDGTGEAARAALVIKLHHTYTDGLGAMLLASELFDAESRPTVTAPSTAPGGPALGGVWRDAAFEARRALGQVGGVVPWAAAAVRDAAFDPEPRAREALALVRDMQVLGQAARSPGSPRLAGRSTRSSFAAIDLPLADLRAIAAGAGGTVNDVFLAGILGGLRLYHDKHGEQPAALNIGIPASTRNDDPTDLRNQFVPLVVRAPLQPVDAHERIRLLHELVVDARRRPALDMFDRATGWLRRLPGGLSLAAGLLGSVDLMASNVPGSPVALSLTGTTVQRMIPFGPRGGVGLNLTLLSHDQTVHIGVNSDAESLSDRDVLVDCLRRGFDETLS
jgi:WS/DGAT/MGAT family acyltransferase